MTDSILPLCCRPSNLPLAVQTAPPPPPPPTLKCQAPVCGSTAHWAGCRQYAATAPVGTSRQRRCLQRLMSARRPRAAKHEQAHQRRNTNTTRAPTPHTHPLPCSSANRIWLIGLSVEAFAASTADKLTEVTGEPATDLQASQL